jgi:hypothetical protein
MEDPQICIIVATSDEKRNYTLMENNHFQTCNNIGIYESSQTSSAKEKPLDLFLRFLPICSYT